MRGVVVALALAWAGLVPSRLAAQQFTARFEITSVSDSTFTFAVGPQRWVAERRRGIVVDPARRDALVARFRILSMQSDTVTALVTGQTTLVTAQHVVVMNPPPPATWYKRSDVWRGSALGALAGLIVGGLLF